jgi:hypothetical protein
LKKSASLVYNVLQAVESMRRGMSPAAAAEDAMRRILAVVPHVQGALVTMNATGSHGAAAAGWTFKYTVASGATNGRPNVLTIAPLTGGQSAEGAGEDARWLEAERSQLHADEKNGC